MTTKKNYLVFGAGAIGTPVSVWLKDAGNNVSLFDKDEVCQKINNNGIDIYWGEEPGVHYQRDVQAYSNLEDVPEPDVIVLCIKNYSLDAVSDLLSKKFGRDIPIVALQNGVENQQILPKYFNKVIYGVVCFNAWVDGHGMAGYQKKGPIALGHKGDVTSYQLASIVSDFNKGVETLAYKELANAAHAKIVINLTNSLTTLVALHKNDLSKSRSFQKLLTSMTYEGVKVMKAAGYKESKLGGMPGWGLITAAGILPGFITRKPYLKNLKKMVVSSMAQDIIVNGSSTSELESINGYVLALAKAHAVDTPVNNAVYAICKEEFAKVPFEAVTVESIWKRVKQVA